jgi:[acyl-carrier-protein] S-malonyltransferase
VIGGQSTDLDLLAQEALRLYPRKHPVRLKTEGAFHTYFMVTAAQHFRPILGAAEIATPAIRVLSNYSGHYHAADATSIRARLFFQLFHPVLWFKNMQQALTDGVTTVIEFGGGIGSGDAPISKRPNLEGIIKKLLRSTNNEVQYLAAINSQTLKETTEIWRSGK